MAAQGGGQASRTTPPVFWACQFLDEGTGRWFLHICGRHGNGTSSLSAPPPPRSVLAETHRTLFFVDYKRRILFEVDDSGETALFLLSTPLPPGPVKDTCSCA